MNRLLPLVLVLGLVLAGLFVVLGDPPPVDEPLGPILTAPAGEDPTSARADAELDDAGTTEATARRAEVAGDPDGASLEDLEAAAPEVLPWPEDGIELTLVRAADGAPAAEALVTYLAGSNGDMRSTCYELLLGTGRMSVGRLARAETYRADASGRVRVPDPVQEALVQVRAGDAWGFELLGGIFEEDLRVELEVPRTLEVRVEDGLGVPVADQDVALGGPWSQVVWGSPRTDARGLAEVTHANTLLRAIYGQEPPLLEVSVDTWDGTRVGQEVDLRAMPADPVRLVLPVGGEVRVSVATPGGEALDSDGCAVELEVRDGATVRTLMGWTTGSSEAVFRNLPAGAAVVARLGEWADEGELAPSEGVVPQPEAGPLHLVVTVVPPPDRSIVARLVDADGNPLAGETCYVSAEARSGRGTSSSSTGGRRTDDEGRVDYELQGFLVEGAGPDRVLRLTFSVHRVEGPAWVSEPQVLEGPFELPMDLGDVVCAMPPLLVAGRLEDTAGRPIEGGWVRAKVLPPGEDPTEVTNLHWAMEDVAGQTSGPSDEDGRFAVHGRPEPGGLYVTASADGFGESDHLPVRVGSADVVVRLGAAGSLLGSARIPDGSAPDIWSMGIQPAVEADRTGFSPETITGGWRSDGTWWDSDLQASGQFGWRDLEPGVYNVRLRCEGIAEPLETWLELRVRPGEALRDPRLQKLELGDLVTAVEVEVVDGAGQPVDGAVGQQVGSRGWASPVAFPGGRRTLMLAETPAAFRFSAPGYLDEDVDVTAGPLRVTLLQAPTLTLTVPRGLVMPEGGELRVGLVPVGAEASRGPHVEGVGFVDGRATVRPTALGELRVLMALVTAEEGWQNFSQVDWPDGEPTVTIDAGSDGLVVDLDVTQGMVDGATGSF